MISLRSGLNKIGELKPGVPIPPIPSGFHSFPKSLKSAIYAMNPPLIQSWKNIKTGEHDNEAWTEECQGIVSDGNHWYVVSNNEDIRAIYKFTLNFQSISSVGFPEDHHIGAPGLHDGKIFVPVEGGKAGVWKLDTNLSQLGIFTLGGSSSPQGGNMPWCAINPWNGLLYSSIFGNNDPDEDDFGNVDKVHAYDPNNNFIHLKDLKLHGQILHRVQGGCISKNGHLYLACDTVEHEKGHIYAYSMINGSFLGSLELIYDDDVGAGELESISINHITHTDGQSTYAHVLVLDNDAITDDVYLYHFAVPAASVV